MESYKAQSLSLWTISFNYLIDLPIGGEAAFEYCIEQFSFAMFRL